MVKIQEKSIHRLSIAPMLDWTDKHFLTFLRFICHRPMFYTEMVAAPALILGKRAELLSFNPSEQPLTLQVGGSDAHQMGLCAEFAADFGYRGININAGCPSSRVQSGQFGAVLMNRPQVLADCVAEMRARSPLPVSVKTRISLSDTTGDGFDELFHLTDLVHQAGCYHIIVHARKAKLNISPKENRGDKLPLNYEVVYRLKKSFPDMIVSINGNVLSTEEIKTHLQYVDGVMIGRWAYGNPYALATTDQLFYGDNHPILSRVEILKEMIPYLEQHRDRLSVILPHLMGLFHGQPNARQYKQMLMSRDIDAIRDFISSF